MDEQVSQSTIDQLNTKAEKIAGDRRAASKLIATAISKASSSRTPLNKVWADLQSLIRLLSAWVKGEYRGVSAPSILAAIGGLIYFVNPFDVMPDYIPGIGLIDDATVLAFIIAKIRGYLQTFAIWETSKESLDTPST